MKLRTNLMTGLIGLAMLAAPITAAAKDNDSGNISSHPVAGGMLLGCKGIALQCFGAQCRAGDS